MAARFPAILSVALALGACGKSQDGALGVAVMGDSPALKERGVRLSPQAQLVRAATTE